MRALLAAGARGHRHRLDERRDQGVRPGGDLPGGDIWLESVNPTAPFSPITINPGQSATINVTITPTGPVGTVISGDLYVDDFVNGVSPYGQLTGDELAAIPYEYTIGK